MPPRYSCSAYIGIRLDLFLIVPEPGVLYCICITVFIGYLVVNETRLLWTVCCMIFPEFRL